MESSLLDTICTFDQCLIFSKGDHFRISYLLQEVHSIKEQERNVTQFFTDLKILWEELECLRPIPSCVCNTLCSCALFKFFFQYRGFEYVMCFLKGLGEIYNTVKTRIPFIEPFPNIKRVFSLEIHKKGSWKQQEQGS